MVRIERVIIIVLGLALVAGRAGGAVSAAEWLAALKHQPINDPRL